MSPEVFYAQAKAQLYNIGASADIDTLRAHAILAIASIQNGKIKDMHLHLGMYHTLVAMDALHDESNWPKDLGNIEREERRRLVSSQHRRRSDSKKHSLTGIGLDYSFGPSTH
jgi:hypothetical protein